MGNKAATGKNSERSHPAPPASFDYVLASQSAGGRIPAAIAPGGGRTLIDGQKMRNNWARVPIRQQIATCRRVAELNWFASGVLRLRLNVSLSGFALKMPRKTGKPGVETLNATLQQVETEAGAYDVAALANDIAWEDLVASNVVALWRKGQRHPMVTILDGEQLEYRSCGGLERITLSLSQDKIMANDQGNRDHYIEALGARWYAAACKGGSMTILRGQDQDWEFEVMAQGKRRGVFCAPELVSLLDDLDWIELMKVGDWNLGWFRKDVLRLIRKGYAVTVGQGAGVNSVNITKKDIDALGKGMSSLDGNANIPLNHDVQIDYLTLDPTSFDPKQMESCIERLLFWGGIEAVALFGSFSQQNGAAPSLMRNARVNVFTRRARIEAFLRRIFSHQEFEGILPAGATFRWSVKCLYSIAEIMEIVRGTADGTASPQTRRDMLDLDDEIESQLHEEAHAHRKAYVPPFETRQALVAPLFPDEFGQARSTPEQEDGTPGPPPSTDR